MNERIQQLWSQAEEEIKAEYEDESRRNRRLYNEIFLPKFAELIVRDCMDVVDGYTKPRTFDTHYDAVAQIEALFGIKHFGVEE
jgi:hypothetical protein